jgi:hypothetical protein
MPRLVVIHAVEDVERWLEGKAERAAAISAVGTNVTDYVALDGSNKIAITAEIHDLDAAKQLFASPPPDVAGVAPAPLRAGPPGPRPVS